MKSVLTRIVQLVLGENNLVSRVSIGKSGNRYHIIVSSYLKGDDVDPKLHVLGDVFVKDIKHLNGITFRGTHYEASRISLTPNISLSN